MTNKKVILAAISILLASGCVNLHLDPVTVNVNFHVIDEKLDSVFAFQQKYEQPPATQFSQTPTKTAGNVNSQPPLQTPASTPQEQRYPQLRLAEDAGIIGETSAGLVETVDPKYMANSSIKKLIDDENTDRNSQYQLIATQEKVDISIVTDRAGKRNFEKAKPGDYLKSADGKWTQKK